TVVSWEAADLDAVNRHYGTSLRASQIATSAVPAPLRWVVDRLPLRLALLKWSIMTRFAARLAPSHDILISADNEIDLGRRAIQYMHYPRDLRPRPAADLRWYHHPAVLLDLYYAFSDALRPGSREQVATNLSLANSTWTAEKVKQRYGLSCRVVYPPVGGGFPAVPWEDRDDSFVCMGRFAPEKELERVFEILAGVRRVVPGVSLHLIGSAPRRGYYRRLVQLAGRYGPWIRFHENLPRDEMVKLVPSHRYGIHGMSEEHFGIAPAELVRAGCLVFVPDGGGQVDIVGSEPLLRYRSIDDAVEKIVKVLTDRGEQRRLLAHLAPRRGLFSVERFVQAVRDAVDEMARDQRAAGVGT
ncbi:MAG TPA: glycosyltransferase, partial [Vicinamibacterales bacterium]|nr:glycosyltransferase [Vicinamibacterales bacterium]